MRRAMIGFRPIQRGTVTLAGWIIRRISRSSSRVKHATDNIPLQSRRRWCANSIGKTAVATRTAPGQPALVESAGRAGDEACCQLWNVMKTRATPTNERAYQRRLWTRTVRPAMDPRETWSIGNRSTSQPSLWVNESRKRWVQMPTSKETTMTAGEPRGGQRSCRNAG